jgi:hypothetical protein
MLPQREAGNIKMDDPIRHYQDAMRAYEAMRAEASRHVKGIRKVSSAMQNHLAGFLAVNYELGLPDGVNFDFSASSREVQFNMDEWPNTETLKTALTNWYNAFVKVRDAWLSVPSKDRTALTEPPKQMLTS